MKNQLASLNIDEEQKLRRMDMLDYQIAEIEAANIKIGEWDELREKQTLFRNIEKLSRLCGRSTLFNDVSFKNA